MYKPQKWWFPCLHTCRRSYQWNTVQQGGCCYCWTPKFVGRYRSRRRSRSPPRRRWRTLPTLSKTEVHNRRRDACAGGDPAPPRHTIKRPALSDLRVRSAYSTPHLFVFIHVNRHQIREQIWRWRLSNLKSSMRLRLSPGARWCLRGRF